MINPEKFGRFCVGLIKICVVILILAFLVDIDNKLTNIPVNITLGDEHNGDN